MTANAIGCDGREGKGSILDFPHLCHQPAATQDRGIMATLSVSVAIAEIANPLGLRVVARYSESW